MKWLKVILGVMIVLLFVGGPDSHDNRIYKAFWDLGHVPLFAGLIFLACRLPIFARMPEWRLFVIFTVATLVVGSAIEWAQLLVARSFSYDDVLGDVIGSYLGLTLYLAARPALQPTRRVGLYALLFLLVLVALRPVSLVLVDEYVMREEFPILADFETPFELSRWDNNLAQLQITDEQVRYGKKSMRVDFSPGKYPDVSLMSFPANWSEFKSVHFSAFSTLPASIIMEIKVYDNKHAASGYDYNDRFNRELVMIPGWNDVEVRMADIAAAPHRRSMDLEHIASLSLFIEKLERPAVFYVDGLRLSSK